MGIYTDRFFLDGWYTDEAKERISTIPAYRVAIDICKEAATAMPGDPLKIAWGEKQYTVESEQKFNNTRKIILSDCNGWPMMVVRINEDGDYQVENWHTPLKKRGKERNQLTSKNAKRIVTAVKPMLYGIVKEAHTQFNADISGVGSFAASTLMQQNSTRIPSGTELSTELVYELLGHFFGDIPQVNIGTNVRDSLRQTYDRIVQMKAKKRSMAEKMQDLFAREKWMVGYASKLNYGYHVGTVKFSANDSGITGFTPGSIPFKRYKTLDHFYGKNPSVADELKAALTLFKVHREQVGTVSDRYLDSDKYFIQEDKLYDGIDVCTYFRAHNAISHPQWLMMDRSV